MAVKKKAVKTKAARKKTVVRAKTAKKATTKSSTARKSTARKTAARKTAARKTSVKKAAARKPAAKKAVTKTSRATRKAAPKKHVATRPARSPALHNTVTQIGPVPGIAPYVGKKGEEYMSDRQVAHFRNILQTWKRSLMEEVDRTVHHMQDDAANFPDPNDRATQESEFSMELRARDRERKLIKKIDESIRHLDNDDFGYCEACGVEIGVKRLEARPTATLCIDCKILDEIREKQMG
jgi:RNA polymerase-binding transcription factor